MHLKLIVASALFVFAASLSATEVNYKAGKVGLKGYLAMPDDDGSKRPGVLVIHQWLGLTDYEKGRAEQIAKELGYVALAADIYGEADRPADRTAARPASGKYKGDLKLFRARIKAGLDALKKQPGVDPKNLAVIGYCFGGTGALEAARDRLDAKAVVSFHGGLGYADQERRPLKAAVLVLHGADDPAVPDSEVAAFEAEMRERKADWQLVKYSDAVHSFTQPMAGSDKSKGSAYNAKADQRSWQTLKAFLAEQFGR
jgi:dienelactone hydrolase